jgi:hypothetical protein
VSPLVTVPVKVTAAPKADGVPEVATLMLGVVLLPPTTLIKLSEMSTK